MGGGFLVMNYKRLLRLGSMVETTTVEPTVVSDETTYLTDDEVGYLMTQLKYIQDTYFPDIPLSKDLKSAKKFIYNIPRNVYEIIVNHNCDDVYSPLYMIYPLLAEGLSECTQRRYLNSLSYSVTDDDMEDEEDE